MVSADVKFFENVPFSSPPTPTSQGEADDLLVYTIASPVAPPVPAPVKPTPPIPAPVKPPITQVYTRLQNPPVSGPPLAASTSDPVSDDDLPIALRKGRRQCIHRISSFCTYNQLSSRSCSFIASLDSISLPNTFQEALSHPGWRSAMIEEMDALNGNGTWNLVHLPTGKKAIGCCWVFAVKVNSDGLVARLKARLVAKGYAQTYGVDYSDTFSPVAKMTSVRLFISLAATHIWDLHQLDIKKVFLHGDLQEEVYMEQPPGFVVQGEIGKVCHLQKSLLGAKPCSSPIAPGVHLTKEGELFEDPERYRRLVGKLNYLTVTRPDITHSISVVSQYMSSPTVDNWAAVEHILCYLKGAPGRGILYSNHEHNRVECFPDADWARSKEDRRSTSSYYVFVGGNLVSWKSKKQVVVSCLSAKSEYRAMA